MRLFVAVEFTSHVCDAIQSAIESFPVRNPPWRWAKRANWHLTLKFLGETPESDVPAIESALAEAAGRHVAFDISLGALGGFPNLKRPRVLFYRVEKGDEHLAALAADVDTLLAARVGTEKENRPFRAHATVARIKEVIDSGLEGSLKGAPAVSGASQPVGELSLVRSQLTPQGARYECLKQFALPTGP